MKQVKDFIEKHHLIQNGDRIVVGLSGGADSVCLLFVLLQMKEVLDLSLFALHVNHNLRGQEALRDERYAEELCQQFQVPLKVVSVNVEEIAKAEKTGTEEAGRNVRYQAFEAYAREVGATKIALAHHQNDLAETMIWHLARGTDLSGLAGICPKRGMYIRPLLCMNRQEIEGYLKKHAISYVTDSTNREDCYTRNRIRHHVVEYLEAEVNPRTVEHMWQTAESLRELYDYLQQEASELLRRYGTCSEEQIFLDQELFSYSPVPVGYVLRMAVEKLAGQLKNITREHIEQLESLAEKEVGKQIHLPYHMIAQKEYDGMKLYRLMTLEAAAGQAEAELRTASVPLLIPGETILDGSVFLSTLEPGNIEQIVEKKYTKWLNYDRIKSNLVLRFRQTGDYIVINEQGGTKKLKDYFIDSKIPKEDRDRIPLLASGSEVIWICGHRISEAYKVKKDTKSVLKIQLQGGDVHE